MLDSTDNVLIPDARNSGLKTLLEKTRPFVSKHVVQAQRLKAELEHRGLDVQ